MLADAVAAGPALAFGSGAANATVELSQGGRGGGRSTRACGSRRTCGVPARTRHLRSSSVPAATGEGQGAWVHHLPRRAAEPCTDVPHHYPTPHSPTVTPHPTAPQTWCHAHPSGKKALQLGEDRHGSGSDPLGGQRQRPWRKREQMGRTASHNEQHRPGAKGGGRGGGAGAGRAVEGEAIGPSCNAHPIPCLPLAVPPHRTYTAATHTPVPLPTQTPQSTAVTQLYVGEDLTGPHAGREP